MNTPTQAEQVAVVCERGGDDAAQVERHLQAMGLPDAKWYAPRDIADLDQAVRAGQVGRVVFPTAADFLNALWSGSLSVAAWRTRGAQVGIAASAEGWTAAHLAKLVECWDQAQQRQRRARAVAGLLLSALAIAAAFVSLLLAR
jgi:hypothetical protein